MSSPDRRNPVTSEKAPIFQDSITLGEPLSLEQAILKLKSFHEADPSRALNLDSFLIASDIPKIKKVTFNKSVSNGAPCICMECLDENGNKVSDTLINRRTGQPIPHIS